MQIQIDTDLDKVMAQLDDFARSQVPFASALALTTLAKKTQAAEKREMQTVFDRPTRFTLNSLFVRPASKKDWPKTQAVVWFRDFAPKGTPAGDYLKPQIHGGSRKLKRSERAVQHRGLLPNGKYLYPSRAVKRDRYGNLSKGQITKMLSNLQAQHDSYQNTTDRGKIRYFVAYEGKKPLGIYSLQSDGDLFPFMVFGKKPTYKARYDFFGVAEGYMRKHYAKEFGRALGRAIASSKRRRG